MRASTTLPRPLRSTPDTYGHVGEPGLQYDKFNPRHATSSDVIACLAVLKSGVDNHRKARRETTGKRDLFLAMKLRSRYSDRFTVFYARIFITLPLRKLSSVLIEKKPRRVAINGTWRGRLSFLFSLHLSLSLSNNQNAARWIIPPLVSSRRTINREYEYK